MPREATIFGTELKRWRLLRGKTQFELAERSGYSQRHVSFLEIGRSRPTRESVMTLAETLDVPVKDRNSLLISAGFAPIYSAETMDSGRIAVVIDSFQRVLESSRPFPSMLVDRTWNVHRANENLLALIKIFAPNFVGADPLNALTLCLDETGLRPAIENWPEFGRVFLNIVRRDLSFDPSNTVLQTCLQRLQQDEALVTTRDTKPESVALLVLKRGELRVELFTMVSSVEEPNDATLSNLRVETFFPFNERTRELLMRIERELRGTPG